MSLYSASGKEGPARNGRRRSVALHIHPKGGIPSYPRSGAQEWSRRKYQRHDPWPTNRYSPSSCIRARYRSWAWVLDHCQPNQRSKGTRRPCTLHIISSAISPTITRQDGHTEILTKIIDAMICHCLRSQSHPRRPITTLTDVDWIRRFFDLVIIVVEHLSEKFLSLISL